jgi:long-chain fatty acid transport protein
MKFATPHLHISFLICALFALLPARTHALGIRLWPQDPEAVARGSAFVATADDAAAVYYNPAGITQLEGQHFLLSSYGIIYDVTYHGANGASADTPDKLQYTAQIFYTLSLKNAPVSFGLGIYEPYGLSSEWSDGGPFRTIATKSALMYVTFNPVVAVKINDSLSVGAGLRVEPAHLDLRRGILVPGDEFKFTGDGTAVGFNAGILFQPHRMHSFGLRYFSETSIDFDGDVRIRTRTPFFFPSSKESGNVKLNFPQHIVFGWSFRPTPDWNFEFDLDWTDWDRVGVATLHKKSGDLVVPFNWQSGFTYEFGVTRRFSDRLSLSAGYLYAEQSVPDATFNPAVPDMPLHVFSIGPVYEWDRWRLALTYQFTFGSRTVSGSAPSPIGETADGHYHWTSNAVMLGAGMKF